jgi:two-component system, OmpR family, sensor histidine kinase VicK
MLESFLAVSLHFTVEFLGFLATAGGAVLVVVRPGLIPGSPNRVVASGGLATLAAAQIVHGGAFVAGDGAHAVVALWTVGFLLLLVGIAGVLRPGANLVSGLSVKEPFLFLPAMAALMLAVVALFKGSRRGPKSLMRLAAGSFALGVFEILTALDPAADFGKGPQSGYVYAAHAFKLIGFVLLASWLWSSVGSTIRGRFVAAFATLLVVVVLALSTALTGVISVNVADAQLRGVNDQLDSAISDIQRETSDLIRSTGQIATLPEVRSGVARSADAARLVRFIERELDFYSIDFVAVLDSNGKLLAASSTGPVVTGAPSKLSRIDILNILGSPVVAEDLLQNQRAAGSLDVIPMSNIPAILGGAPVKDAGAEVAGYLVTGRYLDQLTVQNVADVARPSRVSIVVNNKVFASTLEGTVPADELIPSSIRDELTAGGSARLQQNIAGKSFFSAFAPLRNAHGLTTNADLVVSAPASVVANTRNAVIRILFIVALVAGGMVVLLAWVSGRRITRPIQLLTAAAGAVREGDLSVTAPVGGKDELGQLGETFNDMTAALRRQTEDLRTAARDEHRLRERIEKIVQSIADGLVAVDSNTNIVAFNAEAEVMTGFEAAEVIGRPITETISTRNPQGEPIALPIFQLGEGSVAGIFLERRSGEPVPISSTSAILRDEGGRVAGGVAVLRDMTREREIDRMKSDFLANISHELRTPLTPIKGYAEILGDKDLPPEKSKRFARGILDSTARLERIVALLVDFAALEAGRLAPSATPVDVKTLVEKLAEEWRQRAPDHQLEVNVNKQLPEVIGDARLLRRSLEEILDNAVKFSPDGGIIRVEARATGANGHESLELVVSDEGIGISRDDLSNVFSDFHQLDPSETRAFGGLGLGLAFVRRIVEAHDGMVELESEPDRGTRLTIKIPATHSGS